MSDKRPADQHPRGTLAVVALFGAIFVLTYLAVFFFIYLPRGVVTP